MGSKGERPLFSLRLEPFEQQWEDAVYRGCECGAQDNYIRVFDLTNDFLFISRHNTTDITTEGATNRKQQFNGKLTTWIHSLGENGEIAISIKLAFSSFGQSLPARTLNITKDSGYGHESNSSLVFEEKENANKKHPSRTKHREKDASVCGNLNSGQAKK